MRRHAVNKFSSAKSFRRGAGRTKALNVRGSSRGGIRL
jgi:hypothetical protein